MADCGVGTAKAEVTIGKAAVENKEHEFERNLGILTRRIVDLVVTEAALWDSACDDPAEVVLWTAFLQPDTLEAMVKGLRMCGLSIQKGFHIQKNVLPLRGFAELV